MTDTQRVDAERFGPIEHDATYDRDYIPLPGGWEVQTKGNGSTYRIARTDDDDGERWPVTDRYLQDALTNMAHAIRADYAALLQQLAGLEAEVSTWKQNTLTFKERGDRLAFDVHSLERKLEAAEAELAERDAEIARLNRLADAISRDCNDCANQRNEAMAKAVAAERLEANARRDCEDWYRRYEYQREKLEAAERAREGLASMFRNATAELDRLATEKLQALSVISDIERVVSSSGFLGGPSLAVCVDVMDKTARGLLREVCEWIEGWSPNFVDDPEWQPVADRIAAFLAANGGRDEA